nr:J482 [uncultured bacterium]
MQNDAVAFLGQGPGGCAAKTIVLLVMKICAIALFPQPE